ncbi:hypothetical protein BM221_003071 [Beauveria bassiana]|uniref:Uncharacterized protein n=1 Tax=Beauveria bassiana TaxID=176275 RepID=A0A2N6NTL8_BEABA|nr:hypothetical protein BM221_003071 [Beauveria bassiana]
MFVQVRRGKPDCQRCFESGHKCRRRSSSSRSNLLERSDPNLPCQEHESPHRISNTTETYGSMRHNGEDPALTGMHGELLSLRAEGQ